LVQEEDEDLGELVGEMVDEHTCTGHLARQLGFTSSPLRVHGLHELLLDVIHQIAPLFNTWPLPDDGRECSQIAEAVTRWLTPGEAYAILWAGPKTWRKDSALPHTYAELDRHFKDAVRRGVGSGLKGLFVRWNEWDIPRLHKRWKETDSRRHAEDVARQRPTLSPEQLEQQKRDRADRRKRTKFIPPPPGTYEFKKTG
jgi:hypothetical protein